MDLSHDQFAAIGQVVVEATNMEYCLTQLVATRWGWGGQQEQSMIASSGSVRKQVTSLIEADPDWDTVRHLKQDAFAVLDRRNALVHSAVVHVRDDNNELQRIELWHAKSGKVRGLPSIHEVEQLACDLRRCSLAVAMTIPEAKQRFDNLGAAAAPPAPASKRQGPD